MAEEKLIRYKSPFSRGDIETYLRREAQLIAGGDTFILREDKENLFCAIAVNDYELKEGCYLELSERDLKFSLIQSILKKFKASPLEESVSQ